MNKKLESKTLSDTAVCSPSLVTPETDVAGDLGFFELKETSKKLERQRNAAVMLAGELVAIIRINSMRGTWAEATPEQVDEFLAPWIEKLRVAQGHSLENDQNTRTP